MSSQIQSKSFQLLVWVSLEMFSNRFHLLVTPLWEHFARQYDHTRVYDFLWIKIFVLFTILFSCLCIIAKRLEIAIQYLIWSIVWPYGYNLNVTVISPVQIVYKKNPRLLILTMTMVLMVCLAYVYVCKNKISMGEKDIKSCLVARDRLLRVYTLI